MHAGQVKAAGATRYVQMWPSYVASISEVEGIQKHIPAITIRESVFVPHRLNPPANGPGGVLGDSIPVPDDEAQLRHASQTG